MRITKLLSAPGYNGQRCRRVRVRIPLNGVLSRSIARSCSLLYLQLFAEPAKPTPQQPLLNRLFSVSPRVTYLVTYLHRRVATFADKKKAEGRLPQAKRGLSVCAPFTRDQNRPAGGKSETRTTNAVDAFGLCFAHSCVGK